MERYARGRTVRATVGTLALAGLFACVGGLAAQEEEAGAVENAEALSVEDYEGWREWPLYRPGDIELDNAHLASQRTTFDFHIPSGDTMTMWVDVFADAHFKGEPAVWVQHTSSGVPGSPTGTSVIDGMMMDRETFRVLFRVGGGQGGREWSGPYDVTQHHPDRVVRVRIRDDGTVDQRTLHQETNPFDFAAMPYLFPFMELEAGRKFRLENIGNMREMEPRAVGVVVKGRTTIRDATGARRDVWEVEMISKAETTLYTMYVAEEAPFFYGWRFRRIEDGRTLLELRYRAHQVLE